MENLPQSVERIQLDVLDESSCRAAIDQVIAKAGRIDILGKLGPLLRRPLRRLNSGHWALGS